MPQLIPGLVRASSTRTQEMIDHQDVSARNFLPAVRTLESLRRRDQLYLSDAVKHFKHEIVGKQRIHKNPNRAEIAACRPWVLEELKILQPPMIVYMGVSAATSILGRHIILRDWRSRFFASALAPHTFITTHPAAILRTADPSARETEYKRFVEDLRAIATKLSRLQELPNHKPRTPLSGVALPN